jgi:hypothetical protein
MIFKQKSGYIILAIIMGLCFSPPLIAEDFGDMLGRELLEAIEEGLNEDDSSESSQPVQQQGGYSLPNVQQWQVGDRVLGEWSNGKWYPARVDEKRSSGYFLTFDDGDTAIVTADQIAPFAWKKNDRIQCKTGGNYTSGLIGSIDTSSGRNMVFVYYDTGSRGWAPINTCRHQGVPPNAGNRVSTVKLASPKAPSSSQQPKSSYNPVPSTQKNNLHSGSAAGWESPWIFQCRVLGAGVLVWLLVSRCGHNGPGQ